MELRVDSRNNLGVYSNYFEWNIDGNFGSLCLFYKLISNLREIICVHKIRLKYANKKENNSAKGMYFTIYLEETFPILLSKENYV